ELPIERELPVVDSTVQVRVPKEAPFHFHFEQLAPPDPVIKQSGYSTIYSWRLGKTAAKPREVLSPPRGGARLILSTFPDWGSFVEWYGRLCKLADEMTPEITAKAEQLIGDAQSTKEKVLAVYNYVSGLRYVAIPLGVNSLRPHAAVNVLQNQFGDCKDKANLFNALLHSLNIEAQLVLVPRFSQAYQNVPGLPFNHAISGVNLGSEIVYVDTTDEVCRFGLLPPGDPGRNVLVLDGTNGTLTELPLPESKEHRLELKGLMTCAGMGCLHAR